MELGLRFRDRIEAIAPELSQEFDELMENLLGAWLNEHTDEDQHGDIHATSLTIRKGSAAEIASGIKTGTIDTDGLGPHKFGGPVEIGGVDAFGAAATEKILISVLQGISGTGTSGAGIYIPRSFGLGESWAIIVNRDSWDDSIGFYDATNNVEVLKLYRTGAGVYSLQPSEDGIATVKLGDHTDADFMFDECAAIKFYERNDAGLGYWQDVAYNAANFTADVGTWTVDNADQVLLAYTLVGKTMTVAWDIANTDVSNAGAVLRIKIPAGATAARSIKGVHNTSDAGAAHQFAFCQVTAGGTNISIFSDPTGAGFAVTAADNTRTFGQLTFEIQ